MRVWVLRGGIKMTLEQLKAILPDGTKITVKDVYNKKGEPLEEIKINACAIGLRSEYAKAKVTCFKPDTLEVFVHYHD